MNKLREIKKYVRITNDKLSGIRTDLVRLDDEWQKWEFPKLVESLRKWTDRNSKTIHNSEKLEKYKRKNVYQIKEQDSKNCESNSELLVSIYCEKSAQKAGKFDSVSSIEESRIMLERTKLCFNSNGGQPKASEYRSIRTCISCKGKHHISIYHKKKSNALLTTNSNTVTYSEVIVSVEVMKCRALIDADAGFSYIYLKFISLINKKPVPTRNQNNTKFNE